MLIATDDFHLRCLESMSAKQVAWMKARLSAGKTPLDIGKEVYERTGKVGECYRVICAAAELDERRKCNGLEITNDDAT